MDDHKIDQAELDAEKVDLVLPTEEELREKVIADFEFDEELDADKIDKLVNKELENRKKLSAAIGAKVKWRDAATKAKEAPPTPPASPVDESTRREDLSAKDVIAFVNAKVPEEDMDEVIEYARFKKIPVAEALKSDVIRASLALRAEQRTTAEAANTGTGRRGPSKASDSDLISNAAAGKIPETDEDIARLMNLKLKGSRS